MIIKDICLYGQELPLKTPFKTALRTVDSLYSIIVEVLTADGIRGYGAASPTAAVTGETTASIVCAIKDYIKPALSGRELSETLCQRIETSIAHNSSAKSAVECAVYDLLAQQSRVPLFRYLGGKKSRFLKNDITISLNSPAVMAADTKKALSRGIEILKIKLGGKDKEDIIRIDAVAFESNGCALRLDANQAWNMQGAFAIIDHCIKKGYNIELIEQPFKYYELEEMATLTKECSIPILADESVFDSHDARRVVALKSADFINIKLAKCGGLTDAAKINSVAEKSCVECLMGCMLESPIGVAAAAHFCAANMNVTMFDLDAAELLAFNPIECNVEFFPEGILVKDEGTGLGIREIGKAERINI